LYCLGAPLIDAGVFCHLVFAKSRGKTQVTPTMPAMLAFIILGKNLFRLN
jgi:hypothetical protein